MVQIVNELSAGGRLGEALGTGIGQGLAALAEHKLKGLLKTRKTEEFKSGLKTAYGDQIPENQLDILAKAMADDPKVAQKFWESQFKQQEEEAFARKEQELRAEKAKAKAAGLPGSEDFEEIEAPEIAGRLPRNERERDKFAKMNQKERLAYQARQDKQYEQIIKRNEPGRKQRREDYKGLERVGELAKEGIDIIKSQQAASGLLGGVFPQRFSTNATNRLDAIRKEIVPLLAARQKVGGKTTVKLLELIEQSKGQPYQSTKVQLKNMEEIYGVWKKAKDEMKAENQVIAEHKGREPHNLNELVDKKVKLFEKERKTAEYKLKKQFPPKNLPLGKESRSKTTGKKYIVAMVNGKKEWQEIPEEEVVVNQPAVVQPQGAQ